jgi:hypothetical protein
MSSLTKTWLDACLLNKEFEPCISLSTGHMTWTFCLRIGNTFVFWPPRVSIVQMLSTSVLALKYGYELNCQEKSKFCKFISKRRITYISFRHSSILRQIWVNFMAPCLVFIRRLSQFSHFFPGFPTFSTWASLKRL